MGLEQFAVGFLICLSLLVLTLLMAIFINWVSDEDVFGYFFIMFFTCIGLGICLTYILYMKGNL